MMNKVEERVNSGYGEYIAFYSDNRELDKETFEKVYAVFNQYNPVAIVNRGEVAGDRYEQIRDRVKKIDSNLEVVFVPRTLYELIFLRQCIQEDLNRGGICPRLNPVKVKLTLEYFKHREKEIFPNQEKCWHLCYFDDAGDNDHPKVREIAYRLNQVIVQGFSPTAKGFTREEFASHVEQEIAFFKAYYQNDLKEKIRLCDCTYPGPASNFWGESNKASIRSMGIRNEEDAEIIRNAIALECSEIARKAFLLYRGSNYESEIVTVKKNENKPFSLSYGTSLFAGSLYDAGAAAFHHMRKGENNAYVIAVPFDKLNSSPFFLPFTNAIVQLSGDGEIFHGRTKVWKGFDSQNIPGMGGGINYDKIEHLVSDLPKEEFVAQFEKYKAEAIQLKPQGTGS